MKRLQEQKAKLQQRIQQQDKQPLSKKECREMRDLLGELLKYPRNEL